MDNTKLAYSYASTQINLPDRLAKKIIDLGRSIDKDDLRPGETPTGLEKSPHVTVRYGLSNGDGGKVRSLLKDEKPAKIRLSGLSLFHQKDYDVLKVDVDSDDLHRLNTIIKSNTKSVDTHPKYNPHITVAYLKKGTGKKYIEKLDIKDGFVGKNLQFSDTEGRTSMIPLGANMKLSEKLAHDICAAAIEKLAALDTFEKEAGRKHKKKPDYGRYAAQTAGAMGGALVSSLMKDLKEKPVESFKTRLYGLINSAADRIFHRSALPTVI